jgi:hypothetical protein
MKPLLIAVSVFLLAAGIASADYTSGFETLIGSPGGTILTGQDGYYLPAGTTSVDFLVYAYVGNTLGLPLNPTGGLQFIGGTGPAGGAYARAQRDLSFAGSDVWTLAYDFATTFVGTGESAQNVGSFSLRSDADNHYIHLLTWVDPLNPTIINAFYMAYDAGGTQFAQPGESPGPEWEGLEVNHWYRASTTVDLGSNKIIAVGITDLETMVSGTYNPADWYLAGGVGGSGPPTSFRFFAGGGVDGNTVAFDNASITEGTTAVELSSWGSIKAMFR